MNAARTFDARALLDVALLLAFGFGVASQIPRLLTRFFDINSPAGLTFFTQGSFILAIWLLLAWRGLGWRHLGLQRPTAPRAALASALALCALLFAISWATETAGLRRDLSNFDALRDDLPYTLFAMFFYGLLSAGVYEEILFRGFLMHRFADIFRRSRAGWIAAAVFQAAIFGTSHLHQGTYGALYTATLSLLVGAYYIYGLRNLWVLVLAHGLYDAARMLYFHLQLTHGGLESLAG